MVDKIRIKKIKYYCFAFVKKSGIKFSALCKLFIFLTIIFFDGCMKNKPTDPLDKVPEIYTPELDTIDTLKSNILSFEVTGNSEYSLFRYRIDNGIWSEFTEGGKILLDMLDEGEHRLEIESKYEGHSKVSNRTFIFYVNSFDSTAVYIHPQRVILGKDIDTITVSVVVKGLKYCDRIHFSFIGASVDSVYLSETVDSLLLFNYANVIDILAPPGIFPFMDVIPALKVRMKIEKEDSNYVSFSCIARDTGNVEIKIKDTRGCLILKK